MVEHSRHLKSFIKHMDSIITISDEQIDETGKTFTEPIMVFSTEGEKIAICPYLNFEHGLMSTLIRDNKSI